jgi:hypothetical protein
MTLLLTRIRRQGLQLADDANMRRDIIRDLMRGNAAGEAAADAFGNKTPLRIDPGQIERLCNRISLHARTPFLDLCGFEPTGRRKRIKAPAPPQEMVLWLLYDAQQQAQAANHRLRADLATRPVAERKLNDLSIIMALLDRPIKAFL